MDPIERLRGMRDDSRWRDGDREFDLDFDASRTRGSAFGDGSGWGGGWRWPRILTVAGATAVLIGLVVVAVVGAVAFTSGEPRPAATAPTATVRGGLNPCSSAELRTAIPNMWTSPAGDHYYAISVTNVGRHRCSLGTVSSLRYQVKGAAVGSAASPAWSVSAQGGAATGPSDVDLAKGDVTWIWVEEFGGSAFGAPPCAVAPSGATQAEQSRGFAVSFRDMPSAVDVILDSAGCLDGTPRQLYVWPFQGNGNLELDKLWPSGTRQPTRSSAPTAPPTTSAAPTAAANDGACDPSELTPGIRYGGAGAGSEFIDFVLTNSSSADCSIQQAPTVSWASSSDMTPIGAPATVASASQPTLTLTPGQSAYVPIAVAQAADFPAQDCAATTPAGIEVSVSTGANAEPDYIFMRTRLQMQACASPTAQQLRVQAATVTPDAPAPAVASGSAPACSASQLAGWVGDGVAVTGDRTDLELVLYNASDTDCTLDGRSRVTFVGDGNGTALGGAAVDGGLTAGDTAASKVALAPGAAAYELVEFVGAPVNAHWAAGSTCKPIQPDGFRVTPPGGATSLFIAGKVGRFCTGEAGDRFNVDAVTPQRRQY